jgi:hypothetical protein
MSDTLRAALQATEAELAHERAAREAASSELGASAAARESALAEAERLRAENSGLVGRTGATSMGLIQGPSPYSHQPWTGGEALDISPGP